MTGEREEAMQITDQEAQYDASAKRLLAQKYVLAHLLVKTVKEFREMDTKEIIPLIEGEPYVSAVPMDGGLTNREMKIHGSRIVGMNTEDMEKKEGMIRFDIIFYVRMKDGLSQIIVNVEAQKDEPYQYRILNRSIYYVSRMISSQKERDFENTNYDDIKSVYSIWICMDKKENSMCHIHLTQDDMIGDYHWRGNLDLINIVMIGLAKELPEQDPEYELHRLLCTLFLPEIPQEERITILENEYDIPVEENFRKDVNVMCNLSQGVREYGMMEEKVKVILKMHQEKARDSPERNIDRWKKRKAFIRMKAYREMSGSRKRSWRCSRSQRRSY